MISIAVKDDVSLVSITAGIVRSAMRIGAAVLSLVLVMGLGTSVAPQSAHAQSTFTVTSTGTADDATIGDGTCATSGGECTLRAAVQEANSDGADDTIEFSIPDNGSVAIILVKGTLPLTEPVTIDGTTSPTYPVSTGLVDAPSVSIDGTNLSSSGVDGIEIQADGVTIKGLGINNFPDEGIQVASSGTNATIADCFVGISVIDGSTDNGNLRDSDGTTDAGVAIAGDGYTVENNVISHNQGDGIYVDATGTATSNPRIQQGNLIGVDADGSSAAGNDGAGIRLAGGGAHGIANNTISGNTGDGVVATTTGFVRLSNVGVSAGGADPIPNGGHGVHVLSDAFDVRENTISGNDRNGIRIGASATSVDGTSIEGNVVGVGANGGAIPNGDDSPDSGAIKCIQSTETGTTSSGTDLTTTVAGNVVTGNDANGIYLTDGCEDWDIQDNFIGTNENYASGIGNADTGIELRARPGGNAGETEVDENVIVDNGDKGVSILGGYHDVTDNYIGVTPNGTAHGNSQSGIIVIGTLAAVENVAIGRGTSLGDGMVGGTQTPEGTGNVIGANGRYGIFVFASATNVFIRENYVGTTPGDAQVGNASDGINVNAVDGTSTDHIIGVDEGETPGGASGATSPDPADGGRGNVLAYNGGDGIGLGDSETATGTRGVSVRGNVTYQNGGTSPQLGIDLGNSGVTSNDDTNDDADDGPNELQNFPIIESISYDSANDRVSITYRVQTTTTNAAYPLAIDFYAADSEASGEGKTYIGTQEYLSSDATTSKTNVIDLGNTPNVSASDYFVATATDANGNTSEFIATASPLPVELAAFDGQQSGEGSVELTWTTASEEGNAGFRVQHQAPGERASWTTLGFVEGQGTTSETESYRFAAEDLVTGRHRFRLQQVDVDGATHLSDSVAVTVEMREPVRLSPPAPNPVRGQAKVSFAVKDPVPSTVAVYNVLGRKVATLYRDTPPPEETVRVDVRTAVLPSGTYFVRLVAGERTVTQRLVVVQ